MQTEYKWVLYFLISLVSFIVLLSVFVTAYKIFSVQLMQRTEDYESAFEFITTYCQDPTKKLSKKLVNQCHDLELDIIQDPYITAIFDTLESLSFCVDCDNSIILKFVRYFETFVWLLVLVLGLTLFFVWYSMKNWRELITRPPLPISDIRKKSD